MAKKIKENKIENNTITGLSPALIALIRESLKSNETLFYGEGDTALAVEVCHTASASRMHEAVLIATDIMIDENATGTDAYFPAFQNFALRYGFLICYTNLEIPAAIRDAWELVLHTRICEDVVDIVGTEKFADFADYVLRLVEARKQEVFHSTNWNVVFAKLAELAGGVAKSIKGLDLKKLLSEFQGLGGSDGLNLDELIKKLGKKFK